MITTFETKLGQTVYMTELYDYLELRKGDYSRFIKRELFENPYFEIDKDYFAQMQSNKKEGAKGQFRQEINVHIDCAKKICMVSKSKKGNEIRNELIKLTKKVENLELFTVKQAAFAIRVINCLKFVENQKQAVNLHRKSFYNEKTKDYVNINNIPHHIINSEFWELREKITGWSRSKIDNAINEYLINTCGASKKITGKDMSTKLSAIDINEAIRVAVLDVLYSNPVDENLAKNFSNLCKNLAKELNVIAEKENNTTLFKQTEKIDSIQTLSIDLK